MSDPLHLTILYEEGGDGWIVSSIPESGQLVHGSRAQQ